MAQMRPASATHLVIIPSYNTGPKLFETVREACRFWAPVWVVVDGSTDGTAEEIEAVARGDAGLRVIRLDRNQGKGAAVLYALRAAEAEGFTHALTMDADGQHAADEIPAFMATSHDNPAAMVLGVPIFDGAAPQIRVQGRKLSNWWADLETLWAGIGDSLYGFRVYPIHELRAVMESTRWMRRFDFDPEAVVRLCWHGIRPIKRSTPVRYLTKAEGGVSHFNYIRDNILLTWMHARLILGFLRRLPDLSRRGVRSFHR
jgi:glycosyltransferase involved in cell wall biosynthesis